MNYLIKEFTDKTVPRKKQNPLQISDLQRVINF